MNECLGAARVCAAGLVLLFASAGCRRQEAPAREIPPRPEDRILVGAHYYRWFPRNFDDGILRERLDPPQAPALGRYASNDPKVIEQHIAWCSEYGIDFLTLDWWPRREAARNRSAPDPFLQASNIADIRFCLFYETASLAFDPKTGATMFTDAVTAEFVADVRRLAVAYFRHPSYLRVDGRPVIILYLTRTLAGGYAHAVSTMRRELRTLGFDPYVIADEAFWGVIADRPGRDGRPFGAERPQTRRIALFDALTAYNPYDWSKPSHAGYGATSRFVEDVGRLFTEYRDAARAAGLAFVPGVLPGYNDRGVRLRSNHFVIPRAWEEGGDETGFLRESLRRLAFPHLDPRLKMLLITSFNEWNEDTAIEPTCDAPATRRDRSASGRDYTQGFAYEGYGTRHLEAVRDAVVAVSGRVRHADGTPAPGVAVEARPAGGGAVLARDTADSRGLYTLSRRNLPPGECEVGPRGAPGVRVTVAADACAAGVDLVAGPSSE